MYAVGKSELSMEESMEEQKRKGSRTYRVFWHNSMRTKDEDVVLETNATYRQVQERLSMWEAVWKKLRLNPKRTRTRVEAIENGTTFAVYFEEEK